MAVPFKRPKRERERDGLTISSHLHIIQFAPRAVECVLLIRHTVRSNYAGVVLRGVTSYEAEEALASSLFP